MCATPGFAKMVGTNLKFGNSLSHAGDPAMKKSQSRSFDITLRALSALILAFMCAFAFAQDSDQEPPPIDPDLEKPPPIPAESQDAREPLPPKVQDEQIEPTVTIRQEEDRRIEEYSQNGRVYMVKITPENGPPYYFMDMDGDGVLERDERSRAFQPVEPAQWKIKEWK